MTKRAKGKPTYLKGNDSVRIPVHRVIDVLKMLDEHGHLENFREQAENNKLVMTLPAETINFAKDFVADNSLHEHAVGKQVINSNGSYDCRRS